MKQEGSLRGMGVEIFSKERIADVKTKAKTQKQRENLYFLSCALTQESAKRLVQNFCCYKLDLH